MDRTNLSQQPVKPVWSCGREAALTSGIGFVVAGLGEAIVETTPAIMAQVPAAMPGFVDSLLAVGLGVSGCTLLAGGAVTGVLAGISACGHGCNRVRDRLRRPRHG